MVHKFDRFFEKILKNKIKEGKLIFPPNRHVVFFWKKIDRNFQTVNIQSLKQNEKFPKKTIESNIRASSTLSGHFKVLKKKPGGPKLPIRRIGLQTHLKLTHRKILQVKNWTIWKIDVWNSSKIEFVFNL